MGSSTGTRSREARCFESLPSPNSNTTQYREVHRFHFPAIHHRFGWRSESSVVRQLRFLVHLPSVSRCTKEVSSGSPPREGRRSSQGARTLRVGDSVRTG